MSKYEPLWQYIAQQKEEKLLLSYEQIAGILSFEIDHSFLNFKKELLQYGWQVKKISMKNSMVEFERSGEV